jgi:hypothetical protein
MPWDLSSEIPIGARLASLTLFPTTGCLVEWTPPSWEVLGSRRASFANRAIAVAHDLGKIVRAIQLYSLRGGTAAKANEQKVAKEAK